MFKHCSKLNKLANFTRHQSIRNASVDLTQRLKGKKAIVTASTEG